jgi:glycosyl transferase family 87
MIMNHLKFKTMRQGIIILFLAFSTGVCFKIYQDHVRYQVKQWRIPKQVPSLTPMGVDFTYHYVFSKAILAGDNPYREIDKKHWVKNKFTWKIAGSILPAVFLWPLALLEYPAACIINMLLLCIVLILSAYYLVDVINHTIITEKSADKSNRSLFSNIILCNMFLAGIICLVTFTSYGFLFQLERGNTHIWAVFLMIVAVRTLIKQPKRIWFQVILLSLALHLKYYPALLFPVIFWRHGWKAIFPVMVTNLALFLIPYPVEAVKSFSNLQAANNKYYNWIGNFSAAGFVGSVFDPKFRGLIYDPQRTPEHVLIFQLIPASLWVLSSFLLMLRGMTKVNILLFFASTIFPMVLLPNHSHDYNLSISLIPVLLLITFLFYNYVTKKNYFTMISAFFIILVWSVVNISLYSFPSQWMMNKYPLFILLQFILTFLIIFKPGMFNSTENGLWANGFKGFCLRLLNGKQNF